MKKRVFLIMFFIVTSLESANSYRKTFQENSATLVWEDEEWPNESFSEYLQRCYTYQRDLQEFKKRKGTAQILDAVEVNNDAHNVLYDAITARDINLLCGSKIGDSYVAQLVDRTDTIFGRMALFTLLNNPTNDVAVLLERQALIKKLVDDEALYEQLKKEVFVPLAKTENMILSFWLHDGFLQSSKRCYYNVPYFTSFDAFMNSSPWALELKSLLGHQGRFLSASISCCATFILPLYLASLATKKQLPDFINQLAYRFQGEGGPILAVLACSTNAYIAAAGIGATTAHVGFNSKESLDWAVDCVKLESLLQKKMMEIAKFFKCIHRSLAIFRKYPEFVELCPDAQHMQQHMQKIMKNNEVKKLIDLLFTRTFVGESSLTSFQGRVLVAYRLMHAIKTAFEPLLLHLGNIDAALSCATLYKEFSHKRVHYSFVEYQESSTPTINAINFWNPLINVDVVVPNSLQLGEQQRRNMIITGPNAGGKSSLIKGLVINLILAQSIGLVAADKMVITPFHTIATYLNIVDDIASGNSLFKAQVLRAQEMVFLAENTSPHLFNFIALDEMFNGTSPEESEAAAYSVAHYLGTFANSMCVLATHHPQMTLLEKESDCFANYKVSVVVHPLKGIYYPFKLETGISQQHIALDILKQEGFDNAIIQHALKLLYNS